MTDFTAIYTLKTKLLNSILNPKYVFGVYFVIAIACSLVKYFSKSGPAAYNNYMIFKGVFYNAIQQKNIYLQYPEMFQDSNHYGIFFSILIAPFALLPDWLGMSLWNAANALVLVFAFHKLPISTSKKAIVAWLCLQEFITASVSLQFNVALTGLVILSAVYIYEKKETKSAIAILIGFFVKIYGIVGLSAFFFVKNKWKFITSLFVGFFVFLGLPMLLTGYHFGLQSYSDWFQSLAEKNLSNQVLGNRQDFSLMGIVRRVLGDASISNIIFLVPGIFVFMLPYIRIKQYQYLPFKLLILCSSLLFMVLFSSGSESPTYIIAVAGVMIWFVIQKERSILTWFLLVFVIILTCFSFSDLFPRSIKEDYIIKYSLKALPCSLVWFRIIYELMTKDFEKNYSLN